MPKADAMERMLSRVPAGFVFTAKLTRTMTHEIDPKNWQAQVRLYRQGIAPLVQADRLRAVLVQLGPAFERTRENRLHLARLLDELQTLPAAVEFGILVFCDLWIHSCTYDFKKGANGLHPTDCRLVPQAHFASQGVG
jgi:uncharacterized protein YecE (DUF72 family)